MRRVLPAAVSAVAAFGLVALGAASPAIAADPDELYTAFRVLPAGGLSGGFAFATVTPGGVIDEVASFDDEGDVRVRGVETLDDDAGVALLESYVDDASYVVGWDLATGAIAAAPVQIVFPDDDGGRYSDFRLTGLDVTPDGTILSILRYVEEEADDIVGVVSVDPATGALTMLRTLPLNDGPVALNYTSIATDPVTGLSYVFLVTDFGDDGVIVVDFAGAPTAPLYFGPSAVPAYEITAADFGDDGTLWFFAWDVDDYLVLARLAGPGSAGAGWIDGTFTSSRVDEAYRMFDAALAVGPVGDDEPVTAPAIDEIPDTGAGDTFVPAAVAGVLLLAGVALRVRRRHLAARSAD